MTSQTHIKNEKLVFKILMAFEEEIKRGDYVFPDIRSCLANQQSQALRKLTMLTEDGVSTYKNKNRLDGYKISVAAADAIKKGSFKGLITEHLVPMKVILSELINLVKEDSLTTASMRKVIYCGQVAHITELESKVIDSFHKSDMPEGWKIGDDPLIRATIARIEWAE